MLKPLIEREEAIYHRLSRAREEVASFPAHLFCFASGVTLIEGKGAVHIVCKRFIVAREC
jgi:hypothetical protein